MGNALEAGCQQYKGIELQLKDVPPVKKNDLSLITAIKKGFEIVANGLIDKGEIDLDVIDKDGRTALWHACYQKWEALALKLINKGADVDISYPLYWAVAKMLRPVCFEIIKRRKVRSLLFNGVDKEQRPLVACACVSKCEDVALKLIEDNEDIHLRAMNNETVIIWSYIYGLDNLTKVLLDRGIDVNNKYKFGDTMLNVLYGNCVLNYMQDGEKIRIPPFNPQSPTKLQWEILRNADPNIQNDNGLTVLDLLCENEYWDVALHFISIYEYKKEAREEETTTYKLAISKHKKALWHACQSDTALSVKLIDLGADVTVSFDGKSIIFLIIDSESKTVVDKLFERNLPSDKPLLLWYACKYGHEDRTVKLIEEGVELKTYQNATVLQNACANRLLKVIRKLMERGMFLKDKTTLRHACQHNVDDLAINILDSGIDVKNDIQDLFNFACANKSQLIINKLIERSVNVSKQIKVTDKSNNNTYILMEYAKKYKLEYVILKLLDLGVALE